MPRPSNEELLEAIAAAGSIRKAAPVLGVDERTVRRWLKADEDPGEARPRPVRILAIDIETKPHLVYVWDLWNQNISLPQIVQPGGMMSFAAKWLGEDEVEFRSEHHDGQEAMVKRAWELLDRADIVLHYNGKKFDVPHIQREFAQLGLKPTSPFKQVDLLKAVKAQFRFPSNKLAYVAPMLGQEDKVSHEGFSLWLKCMAGDEDAWERMRAYNVQDVELLEQLYDTLLPWIPNHPSVAAMIGEDVCPSCGSEELRAHGLAHLRTGRYQRYRCADCGSFSRATRRLDGVQVTAVSAA